MHDISTQCHVSVSTQYRKLKFCTNLRDAQKYSRLYHSFNWIFWTLTWTDKRLIFFFGNQFISRFKIWLFFIRFNPFYNHCNETVLNKKSYSNKFVIWIICIVAYGNARDVWRVFLRDTYPIILLQLNKLLTIANYLTCRC